LVKPLIERIGAQDLPTWIDAGSIYQSHSTFCDAIQ